MKLSTTLNLYSLLESSHSPERMIEAVKVCSSLGYEAIDVYLKGVIHLPPKELEEWITRMERAIRQCGVSVSQCHLYFGKVERDSLEEYENKVVKSFEIADRMGIGWGVIHPIDYRGLYGVSTEESIRLNVAYFRRLREKVKPKTTGLAFENIMGCDFASADVLIAICDEACKYGKAGVCWDTGHANLSEGVDQAESIRALGNRLKCLHAHDNHGRFDEHILPMMGTVDWRKLIAALREIGYEGDFVYESAQPTKHLPEDDLLRKEFIKYSVKLGKYMLENF